MQDLCVAALDCDPADRDSFLTTACGGDLDLRQEIDSLLVQEVGAERFLTASALGRYASVLVPNPPVSQVGQAFGPYEIQGFIGSGGMGEVYRARDRRLHRDVAIKVLPAALSGDADRLQRFEQEARATAALSHPNILAVYDIGTHDEKPFIVSELLTGETLAERLTRGPLGVIDAVDVAIQLAQALAAAHEIGIVHRDLKPANIFITRQLQAKVLDFGLAKMRDARSPTPSPAPLPPDSPLTGRGVGTLAYMSPEQVTGSPVDPRLDVWSLGVVLYEMVTGQRPFRGEGRQAVAAAIASTTPDPASFLRSGLPADLDRVLNRALAKNPVDRPDATELITDLQRVRLTLSQLPALNLWDVRRLRVPATVVPGRVSAIVLGLSIIALVFAAIIGLTWRWRATPRQTVLPPAHDLVLIGAFDNQTRVPALGGLVQSAIERELGRSPVVSSASQQQIDDTLRLMTKPLDTPLTPDVAREVCVRDGSISAFITGRIDRLGRGYAISTSVANAEGGIVKSIQRQASDDRAVPDIVRQLASDVRIALDESTGTIRRETEPIARVTTPSLDAARQFSEGLRVFNLQQFPEAEARFNAALVADPRFASADIWQAWTCLNLRRPAADCLPFAQRAMNATQVVSPHEREWIAGSYAMMRGQDEQAIAEYEALLRRYPDDTWAFYNLRRLYGDSTLARTRLDLEERVADAQPNNFLVQAETAVAFLQSGGLAVAQPHVTRARVLIPGPNPAAGGETMHAIVWTLLFPAHEFWTQGRAADAARVLDAVSRRPEFALERDRTLALLGSLRLSLGQLRLAEDTFRQISDPRQRGLNLAVAALAREDMDGVVQRLKDNAPNDAGVASLLIRAGRVDEASRFIQTLSPVSVMRRTAVSLTNELEAARGSRSAIDRALKDVARWTQGGTGMRTFLYPETLARAAAAIGDRSAAIVALEFTAPAGERGFGMGSHHGYYWMRDQKLLADLYREDGQIDKARAIERDLLARLAVADPDDPLLIQLRQREGK